MDRFTLEDIQLYVAKYLAPASKEELISELSRDDIRKVNYFCAGGPNQALQGDGIYGFLARNFTNDEKKKINGIVISNTCDINIDNKPPPDRLVNFAPLVTIEKLVSLWKERGFDEHLINSDLGHITAQRVSYAFYVPANPGIPESIAFLDQIQAQPLRDFYGTELTPLFRLSNAGFYIFLIKLSIHFNRLFENFDRITPAANEQQHA